MIIKQQIKKIKRILRYGQNKVFTQKSYAQHQEDIAITLLLGKVEKFLDIGANDGMNCSNSFLFALQGAKGLCFEPVASNFFLLKWLYIFNPDIKCIAEGISNEMKKVEIQTDGLISFITETQDNQLKKLLSKYYNSESVSEKISVKPLNYWLNIYPEFLEVDFVSLDIEGHEFYALQGIDFSRFKTKVWIVETHGKNQDVEWLHQDYHKIDELLKNQGYQAMLKNKLNTFWIAKDYADIEKLRSISQKLSEYQTMNL
ncbi:MAG: FkbM family methyltransferase [Trichodesmium sp.]